MAQVLSYMGMKYTQRAAEEEEEEEKQAPGGKRKRAQTASASAGSQVPTAAQPSMAALWMNMREEPVIYVNLSPYVLRDFDTPYTNLENTGISAKRIEAMERQVQPRPASPLLTSGSSKLMPWKRPSDEVVGCCCTMRTATEI